ncbi:uncharacterized protein RCC_02256 [Ramularia collo-cygni]|uniref:Zn(2)-C6 fungal-type domain-containing protein n=1 Tax=Ramularia collo-cygni TaxID=112498 RepID=A0A2D3V7U0_9PEZI|nr:uncharacterized protein RCC_02256 [Ramularia collo-cygni]CZT16413.1 uncharacterized protein RCC_02256 [Ramularia collo-cygni]
MTKQNRRRKKGQAKGTESNAAQRVIKDFFGVQHGERSSGTTVDQELKQDKDISGAVVEQEQQQQEENESSRREEVPLARSCYYCQRTRTLCRGGQPCPRCRKDSVDCVYDPFSVEQLMFVKTTGSRNMNKQLTARHIVFGDLPHDTAFPPMSVWVAAESRRWQGTILSADEAFTLVYNDYVLRGQATPRGRMRLYMGVANKIVQGSCTSQLPLIVQASEWSAADIANYRSWKPATQLFASNAAIPRRDDTQNTEVITLRFMIPDLRSLDALPYAGQLSRIAFCSSTSVAATRADEGMLVVLYLEDRFVVATMPDLLHESRRIVRSTIANVSADDGLTGQGPCWYVYQDSGGRCEVHWFYNHGSAECKQWARARTVGTGVGDLGALHSRLMSEFLRDVPERRTKRLADVFQSVCSG